jgi:DNA-binding protein YbaB
MIIRDLLTCKELVLVQKDFDDAVISGGYTSDLLSDVMAHAAADNVLITIQAHINTVAVAKLVGIRALLIANDREILEDMVQAAQKEKIAIFRSRLNQFDLSVLVSRLLAEG